MTTDTKRAREYIERARNASAYAINHELLTGLADCLEAALSSQPEACNPSCDCGASADNRWPHHDECAAFRQPEAREAASKRKGCGDPTCGCDQPTFTEPMEALRFLSGRFKYAGVAEGVALLYARDIDAILADYTTTPPPDAALRDKIEPILTALSNALADYNAARTTMQSLAESVRDAIYAARAILARQLT